MAVEDLRVIGDVLYERRPDGKLYPVRRVAPTGLLSAPAEDQGSATGIPELDRMLVGLGNANQMFNPVEGIGQSMAASRRMAAPDTAGWDRVAAFGDMLSGVAGVTAPVAAAGRAGTPAAVALMEGLLGGSPTMTAAKDTARTVARTVAERANQRGPVPTMGSNFANLLGDTLPAPRNEAEAIAKNILELRATGNVDAVTEGMMNAADPQYMYNYTPLPMDQASRMARAKQMGFSTDPNYHGSYSENIIAFNGDMLGKRFNNRASKAGVWSSTNPDDAEFYGPNLYPVLLRGKYENLPSMEDMYKDALSRLKSTQDKMERDYMGEKYSGESEKRLNRLIDIMENDQPPHLYTDIAASNISKAKGKKFDGAVLRGGEDVQDISPAGDNYVTFNPTNIRSQFARFDPMFAHLRNLSAGVAISPLAYGLLSDQYARENSQ